MYVVVWNNRFHVTTITWNISAVDMLLSTLAKLHTNRKETEPLLKFCFYSS